MALLDTRDAELCLWQDGNALRSPGFVLHERGEYQFGEPARAAARLRPRDVNNRFWWQLGTQPLKPPLGAARHTADLVHSHLRALHREAGSPEQLVLAVPASMPREQLSLLLGVAQACDFRVTGLASRSVLLAAGAGVSGRAVHVELQLHQAVINEVAVEGGELRLARSTPLPACGLLALQERAIAAIASSFIQQTRFDPRRAAASEQHLYDRLPTILATLADEGECSVEIDGNRCRVLAANLAPVAERLAAALRETLAGDALPVLADRQLQLLAGSGGLPGRLEELADDALWQAFRDHRERICGDTEALHLVDRLPVRSPATHAAPAASPGTGATEKHRADAAEPATHVLIGVRALPLRGRRVDLGDGYHLEHAGGQWSLHGGGALINGLPANPRQALALGDTLSLGSAHGRLIRVVA
jgi:hypothetical protein